jgi:hypothetical protein
MPFTDSFCILIRTWAGIKTVIVPWQSPHVNTPVQTYVQGSVFGPVNPPPPVYRSQHYFSNGPGAPFARAVLWIWRNSVTGISLTGQVRLFSHTRMRFGVCLHTASIPFWCVLAYRKMYPSGVCLHTGSIPGTGGDYRCRCRSKHSKVLPPVGCYSTAGSSSSLTLAMHKGRLDFFENRI